MDKKTLIRKMRSWLRDYEKTTPANVCYDEDESTFDGSAYGLLSETLSYLTQE